MTEESSPRPNWAAKILSTVNQSDINELARISDEIAYLKRRLVSLEREFERLAYERS